MRPIKQNEIELIQKMTEGHFEIPNYVLDMKDGKMGSISFDINNDKSRFKQICSAQYIDSDDILIDIELTIAFALTFLIIGIKRKNNGLQHGV